MGSIHSQSQPRSELTSEASSQSAATCTRKACSSLSSSMLGFSINSTRMILLKFGSDVQAKAAKGRPMYFALGESMSTRTSRNTSPDFEHEPPL